MLKTKRQPNATDLWRSTRKGMVALPQVVRWIVLVFQGQSWGSYPSFRST